MMMIVKMRIVLLLVIIHVLCVLYVLCVLCDKLPPFLFVCVKYVICGGKQHDERRVLELSKLMKKLKITSRQKPNGGG